MDVLVENKNSRSKLMQGLTKNYPKVVFKGEGGHFLLDNTDRIRLISLQGQAFLGKIEAPLPAELSAGVA